MGKFHPDINPKLRTFIEAQQMFFTASATAGGRVNVSPKGIDSLRVLDEKTVAYLDLTGSGNETAAHLRADGRLTLMFCAFEGDPCIMRLFGRGEIVRLDSEKGHELREHFPSLPGERHFVLLDVESVQTSCGFAVPLYDFREQRELLITWAQKQGEEGMQTYRRLKNSVSIDGLPTGLEEDGASESATASLSEQLYALEARLLEPEIRRNRIEIEALLADDFREFGSSGRSYDKAQILDQLANEAGDIRYTVSQFRTQVLASDVALATYHVVRATEGEARHVGSLRSSIWKRQSERWRMTFHQGTLAQEQPPYSIRSMEADDVKGLFEAFRSWNKPSTQYERYWSENANKARATLLATDEAGKVVGYANIVWKPDYAPFAEAGIPEINDMNVVADWQRRGIATAMIRECERIAHEAGHSTLGIGFGLTPDYGAAQRLYPKLGYIPNGLGAVPTPWGDVLYLTKSL